MQVGRGEKTESTSFRHFLFTFRSKLLLFRLKYSSGSLSLSLSFLCLFSGFTNGPQTSIVKTRHTATQPSSDGSLHPTRHVYCTPSPPTWHPTPSRCYVSFATRMGRYMVPPICLSTFNNRCQCRTIFDDINQLM